MHPEDIPKEKMERLKKDLAYEKWKNRNPNASQKQKAIAKKAHALANSFNLPDIDNSWWR